MDLYARSAGLGCGLAHYDMGGIYEGKGDYKKAKFHLEAAVRQGIKDQEPPLEDWSFY